MPIYELTKERFKKLPENPHFEMSEKAIQEMLLDNISVIVPDPENSPELFVITDEFKKWKESNRRIDILCVDSDAKLVVVELKRSGDGGHMDLQAIRYSALISNMTFDDAVETYQEYLKDNQKTEIDAKTELLEFLGESEENINEVFGNDVRVILVSPEFSKEITNTVLWLNDRGDPFITCVKAQPYIHDKDRTMVNIEQIIPLKETTDFTMSYKRKTKQVIQSGQRDYTKYDLQVGKLQREKLTKRSVVHQTIKYLLENGVSKDDLVKNCDRLKNKNVFLVVDFCANSEEFMNFFKNDNIDWSRYFSEDDELVHAGEKTIAIRNQWGLPGFNKVMPVLKSSFVSFNIIYEPAKEKIDE